MNGNKKGSRRHSVPYATEVTYVHPLVDSVRSALEVDVPEELLAADLNIETIEEAIELYLDAHRSKFAGKHGAPCKAQRLRRFLQFLTTRGHSPKLSDLALEDGQASMACANDAMDDSQSGQSSRKK